MSLSRNGKLVKFAAKNSRQGRFISKTSRAAREVNARRRFGVIRSRATGRIAIRVIRMEAELNEAVARIFSSES